jgi:hypothetical protein
LLRRSQRFLNRVWETRLGFCVLVGAVNLPAFTAVTQVTGFHVGCFLFLAHQLYRDNHGDVPLWWPGAHSGTI